MASEEPRSKAEAPPESSNIDLNKVPLEEPQDGVLEAYSNVVNMNWTLHDVRLRFAELIQVPDDDRPTWENQHGVILERAAITMPWHQAKSARHAGWHHQALRRDHRSAEAYQAPCAAASPALASTPLGYPT